VQREILKRFQATVKSRFGEIRVKCVIDPTGRRRFTPEFDACRKVALEKNVPLMEIYDAAAAAVQDEDLLTILN
jgi:uncharacterized protein (DUF111 family)